MKATTSTNRINAVSDKPTARPTVYDDDDDDIAAADILDEDVEVSVSVCTFVE